MIVVADWGVDIVVASRTIPSVEDEFEFRRSTGWPMGLSILGLLSNFQNLLYIKGR